jgi:hypothetical protein
LLGLFFKPEDGSNIIIRNVGWLSTDYTASYLRKQSSLIWIIIAKYWKVTRKHTNM